jgi:hypothetical protein
MNFKRITVLALVLLALSATAALAGTAWQTGDYAGKTEGKYKPAGNKPLRKAKISFHVGLHKVTKIRVEIRVKCADGSHTSFRTEHGGFLSLDANGKFRGGADTQTGRDNISGKVSGSTASGFVRSFDKEDQNGNEDPNGQKCDSGRINWTAAKKPGTS